MGWWIHAPRRRRSCLCSHMGKDLDFWEGFDDMEIPRTVNIDVYSSAGVADCMSATTVHTELGEFNARECGKGRFFDPEKTDVMLTGDNSVLGHYLAISVDNEILQCCQLADLRAEADGGDDDSSADD